MGEDLALLKHIIKTKLKSYSSHSPQPARITRLLGNTSRDSRSAPNAEDRYRAEGGVAVRNNIMLRVLNIPSSIFQLTGME